MPTYEYKCKKCGFQFEVFQSMTDEPLNQCPTCKGELVRLIGAGAGLIFKGSGFYITDYRSDSYNKAKKADHSTDTAASSKSSSPPASSKK